MTVLVVDNPSDYRGAETRALLEHYLSQRKHIDTIIVDDPQQRIDTITIDDPNESSSMHPQETPAQTDAQAEYEENLARFLSALESGDRRALKQFEALPVAARIIALANGGHEGAMGALKGTAVSRLIRNRPVLKGLLA